MSTRFSRAAALVIVPIALAATLSACGSDSADAIDAIGVSGDFGQAPVFKFDKTAKSGDAVTKTLIEGSGDALANGDHVLVNFAIGDATTKATPITTFDDSTGAMGMDIGKPAVTSPQSLQDLYGGDLSKYVKAGVKPGTRIEVAGDTNKVLPNDYSYLPSLKYDVGNADSIALVIDVVGVAKTATGTTETAPAWAPKVTTTSGKPTALDFKGTPKPSGKLRVATLIKGSGPAVAADQTASVQYLGQVYGAKTPFDASYADSRYIDAWMKFSKSGAGADKALSTPVVEGWSKGLIGVPVGSRVIIEIPPALGYGKSGNSSAKIKGTDTIYFLVDVLGAA